MTDGASWTRIGRFVVRFAVLALSLAAFGVVVRYLWRAEHLEWAGNAYAMSQAGAWSGIDAFQARVAYWFFEYRGRTMVTAVLAGAWIGFAWCVLMKPKALEAPQ